MQGRVRLVRIDLQLTADEPLGSLSPVEPEPPINDGATSPTRSSYGREYWLRRCEGFIVETPTKRIGRVVGIRYGEASNEPEVLEVRAGLFRRTQLLVSVDDVSELDTERQRLLLTDPPRLRPESPSRETCRQVRQAS
jgi:hypothetical protein